MSTRMHIHTSQVPIFYRKQILRSRKLLIHVWVICNTLRDSCPSSVIRKECQFLWFTSCTSSHGDLCEEIEGALEIESFSGSSHQFFRWYNPWTTTITSSCHVLSKCPVRGQICVAACHNHVDIIFRTLECYPPQHIPHTLYDKRILWQSIFHVQPSDLQPGHSTFSGNARIEQWQKISFRPHHTLLILTKLEVIFINKPKHTQSCKCTYTIYINTYKKKLNRVSWQSYT